MGLPTDPPRRRLKRWSAQAFTMSSKPTQRSTALCRARGWTYQIVERFNIHAKRRVDLFGVIDVVVLDGQGGGPLGIQCSRGGDHATHRTKALAEPRLREWLASPARFEIWSWEKKGPRGKQKRWTLRVEPITSEDMSNATPELPDDGDLY